jgi:hypothetical protein
MGLLDGIGGEWTILPRGAMLPALDAPGDAGS